ncbi:MAG: SOS response-associated peptidase [Gammaproteobacteria bacterium]|nr:SOS response-associated peptidase [Gammaproteobacteria bacterium]
MCGRFNVISDPLTRLLMDITGQSFNLQSAYNIAPTETVPVLRYLPHTAVQTVDKNRDWCLDEMRWWLVPSWTKTVSEKFAMFNARIETIEKSRAYARPFHHQRCVIPASGYYEWQGVRGDRQPFYLTPADADGFLFAGVWDRREDSDGQVLLSCSMITRPAGEDMVEIHQRVPAMLLATELDTWFDESLSPEALKSLVLADKGLPLNVTPVSSWVNNSRHKDARCVDPTGATRSIQYH